MFYEKSVYPVVVFQRKTTVYICKVFISTCQYIQRFVASLHRKMGQSQSGSNYKTRTSTPATTTRSKPNPDDYYYYVEWESEKFAEGRFRYAIRGTWLRPREKQGQKCVVKHLKSSYTWNKTDWDTTVKIYEEAEELRGLIHFLRQIIQYILRK